MPDSDDDEQQPEQQPKRQLVDDNAGLHPLFWDAMPHDAEDVPEYQALKAIDDELTPEQRAEGLKNSGNSKLKLALSDKADQLARRNLLREAVQFYCDGLAAKAQDDKLNGLLLANRAQAHLLLGNWRKALDDSVAAHKLDGTNVKALFRGAKAALKLGLWQQCVALCEAGSALDPASKDWEPLRKDASAKADEAAALEARQRAQREAAEAPARALADALLARGYRMTLPQVRAGGAGDVRTPSLQPDGSLSWPVLLMYPESMQQDSVMAFGEGDTFDEHLDMMFGPDAPPLEWDEQQQYSRQALELYYLAHAGEPLGREQLISAMQGKWPDGAGGAPQRYGDRAARMRRVDPAATLGSVLSAADHVIPGIPLFWVVAKGTPYRERFLKEGA